jgi:hypothetical protein
MARAVVIQRLKPFEVIAKACLGCLVACQLVRGMTVFLAVLTSQRS